ncbi:MAG: L-threonylcarbamoyladenylate synthase [Patescibacteria group bacterium]
MNDLLMNAVKTLHSGGVVAHATETCYGLAADIFQKKALERLYALKKMPLDKPVSVLVRDLDEAQRYGEFSSTALKLALKYWPGPLTIIVPRKAPLPPLVNYGHPTVGFRVSSNKKTRELLEAFGGPLTTTSANVHGQPQAYSVQDMLDQSLVPDAVLDSGRIGDNPPSTIVEVIGEEVKVVRQGEIKL